MITDKKEILQELKKILSAYSKKLKVTRDGEMGYELYCTKKVTVWNKEIDGMFFSSAMIRGGFTGFYFFPIYTHAGEFKDIPAELKKCLKGKSCFHIKKLDKVLEKQIKDIAKKGYDLFLKTGWI